MDGWMDGWMDYCRLGVSIKNWVEDDKAKEDFEANKSLWGGEFYGKSTMRTEVTGDGKYGAEITVDRKDLVGRTGTSRENLFSHGDTRNCYSTLNNLTYKWPSLEGNNKVHQNLWSGKKKNDSQVTEI